MQIDFVVDSKPVSFRRDQFSGRSEIFTNEGLITLDSPLNPLTHFSLKLVSTSKCNVYGAEVVIEKTRPLFLAAFRPSKYRVFVNGEVVVEQEG